MRWSLLILLALLLLASSLNVQSGVVPGVRCSSQQLLLPQQQQQQQQQQLLLPWDSSCLLHSSL